MTTANLPGLMMGASNDQEGRRRNARAAASAEPPPSGNRVSSCQQFTSTRRMIASTISWVASNSPRCSWSARGEASIVYATDDTGSAMIVNANARNGTVFVTGRSGA